MNDEMMKKVYLFSINKNIIIREKKILGYYHQARAIFFKKNELGIMIQPGAEFYTISLCLFYINICILFYLLQFVITLYINFICSL